MRKSALLGAGAVMLLSASANAQDIAGEVARCGAIEQDAARLKCFDGLLPKARKSDAERRAEAAEKAREEFGLTRTQLTAQDKRKDPQVAEAARIAREENSRFEAKIAAVSMSAYGTMFTLDNGQVWQTTSFGQMNTVPRTGQAVLLKAGPLGGYRLSLKGSSREVGVKRVK